VALLRLFIVLMIVTFANGATFLALLIPFST